MGSCGAEIEVKWGHRGREYCNDRCRIAFHRVTKGFASVSNDGGELVKKAVAARTSHVRKQLGTPEECQVLVNEGKLDPSHSGPSGPLNLAEWGFTDPGGDSYFFPKEFKTHGEAQLKEVA